MYVYLEKFPGTPQELIKYVHDIKLATNSKGHVGCAKYDEQFRF